MTQYGKITAYDAERGAGMIVPERGGEALPFRTADLQQQGQEPRSDQLYTFETQRGPDGQPQAVNVQMEAGHGGDATGGDHGGFNAQGQSEMTVNEERASGAGVDEAGTQGYPVEDSHGRVEHQSRTDGQEGVSRGGLPTARGDAPGKDHPGREGSVEGGSTGGDSSSTGGSTFQPLEADASKAQRSPERQHDLGRDRQGRDERGA